MFESTITSTLTSVLVLPVPEKDDHVPEDGV